MREYISLEAFADELGLEPGVAGPHCDLFSTVGVPVEAGLANEEAHLATDLIAGALNHVAHTRKGRPGLVHTGHTRDTRGSAVLPEDLT